MRRSQLTEKLAPDLVALTCRTDGARDMEVELAISLRAKGYGVWQG